MVVVWVVVWVVVVVMVIWVVVMVVVVVSMELQVARYLWVDCLPMLPNRI